MSRRVGSSAVAVKAISGTPGKRFFEDRELLVFRTEIVTPLRNAVRLVNREQGQRRALEQTETARRHQPFRRDVEEVQRGRRRPPVRWRRLRPAIAANSRRRRERLPGARRRPGPSSARSAAKRQRRDRGATALGADNTAICRRRSASARRHRRRSSTCSMTARCKPRNCSKPNTSRSSRSGEEPAGVRPSRDFSPCAVGTILPQYARSPHASHA